MRHLGAVFLWRRSYPTADSQSQSIGTERVTGLIGASLLIFLLSEAWLFLREKAAAMSGLSSGRTRTKT